MFSLGEIDTRYAGGISAHSRKYNKPLENVLADTFTPALAWLKAHQGTYTFIVTGVPGVNPLKLATVPPEHHAGHIAFLSSANTLLQTLSRQHGFAFVDIYAYTTENPQSFLEADHLIPTALPQALSSHLVTA